MHIQGGLRCHLCCCAGLDSSTTYQIVRCLRDLCHIEKVSLPVCSLEVLSSCCVVDAGARSAKAEIADATRQAPATRLAHRCPVLALPFALTLRLCPCRLLSWWRCCSQILRCGGFSTTSCSCRRALWCVSAVTSAAVHSCSFACVMLTGLPWCRRHCAEQHSCSHAQ